MAKSRLPFAVCFLAFVVTFSLVSLSGQTGRSSLTGVISDPHGVVAEAPIQMKNKATGALTRTASKSDGSYAFSNLPAGTYELTIVMPCCAYNRFSKDVTVDASQSAQLDIRLSETINGTTLGDDPGRTAAMMRKRAKVPNKPVPRAAGGKPDLSGVWLDNRDPYPEQAELLPWAAAVRKERADNLGKDDPHNRCLPDSPPMPAASTPFIGKLVQTPGLLVILFEDVPGFRQIFLDGRGHPANLDPTWMGHSVGKWEGDTLVVDTAGFNDRSWIGGNFPHTEMMRMTERYQRVDYGHMQVHVTFEDPGTFVKPLHANLKWDLAPQEELLEFVCENNKPEHLVGK
ncbi:MAG TPA: carboxypeptidase-like regulatory domain-containing protein [Bryobacteraceae bacterium]|nr:carboxypeptidase-like regulatory domain-containing protein [Bryobacteraceae bacterium]